MANKVKQATLIYADGLEEQVSPANGKDFTLKELQGFVDGRIQIIGLPSKKLLICNDDGRLINLPRNEKAEQIWAEEWPVDKYPLNNDGIVVGNVLICHPSLVR